MINAVSFTVLPFTPENLDRILRTIIARWTGPRQPAGTPGWEVPARRSSPEMDALLRSMRRTPPPPDTTPRPCLTADEKLQLAAWRDHCAGLPSSDPTALEAQRFTDLQRQIDPVYTARNMLWRLHGNYVTHQQDHRRGACLGGALDCLVGDALACWDGPPGDPNAATSVFDRQVPAWLEDKGHPEMVKPMQAAVRIILDMAAGTRAFDEIERRAAWEVVYAAGDIVEDMTMLTSRQQDGDGNEEAPSP